MRAIGWSALAATAALAVGCGEPSEAEQQAAWARKADAICRQAERAVAAHERPTRLKDLRAVAADTEPAGQRALARIRRLERAEGGPAGRFVAALDRLEPPMKALADAAKIADTKALVKAAKAYRLAWGKVETAAHGAGLKVCGQPDERRAVVDGVLTPVFAQQLRDLEGNIARDLNDPSHGIQPRTDQDFDDRYGRVMLAAGDGYDLIAPMEPPSFAIDATARLGNALRALSYAAAEASFAVERPGPASAALLRRLERRVGKRFAPVGRAFRHVNQVLRTG